MVDVLYRYTVYTSLLKPRGRLSTGQWRWQRPLASPGGNQCGNNRRMGLPGAPPAPWAVICTDSDSTCDARNSIFVYASPHAVL